MIHLSRKETPDCKGYFLKVETNFNPQKVILNKEKQTIA